MSGALALERGAWSVVHGPWPGLLLGMMLPCDTNARPECTRNCHTVRGTKTAPVESTSARQRDETRRGSGVKVQDPTATLVPSCRAKTWPLQLLV